MDNDKMTPEEQQQAREQEQAVYEEIELFDLSDLQPGESAVTVLNGVPLARPITVPTPKAADLQMAEPEVPGVADDAGTAGEPPPVRRRKRADTTAKAKEQA